MTVFRPAPEVEAIALRLIGAHHQHLDGVDIRFVFRDEHQTKGDRVVWATTRLVGGLNAWLAGEQSEEGDEPERFFVMDVAADVWSVLDKAGREALVDHELCHCKTTIDGLRLTGHDLEEFTAVVVRHGLWRPEVEALVRAGQGHQLTLEGVE